MQKTLAEVKGCPQKDRTESEGYVGAQTFMWICEDNIVEVPFDKEHADAIVVEYSISSMKGRTYILNDSN